jgi:hypothetical protein
MSESTSWSMDRLAAHNLLASLKLDTTEDNLEQAARHFARHRQSAIEWAAERTHSSMVRSLEAGSTSYFDRHSAEWTDGYRFAEQQVSTMMPKDLLDLGPERTRSKGQVLRALVRQARAG